MPALFNCQGISKMKRILIVGGGIGGLSAALALRREGFEPQVFEQAPALLEGGAAIAVWPNAMRVLRRLGLGDALTERGGLLRHARWMGRDGRVFNHFPFPDEDLPGVALHRADLQGALLRALPSDPVHLRKTFERCTEERGGGRARLAGDSEVACDVLVAADGLHSRARAQVVGDGAPVYRGYTVWRGIARLEHATVGPDTGAEVYS